MTLTSEQLADEKYMEAYHNGRHNCRDKYKKSGLLVVDPYTNIEEVTKDPCSDCPSRVDGLKMGCTKICDRKHKQMDAIEITQHFRQIPPKINGIEWHYVETDGLPPEFKPKYSSHEHTESVRVLVWDSFYGPNVDALWDGEWISERKSRGAIQPAVCHGIVAWAYSPVPDNLTPRQFMKMDEDGNLR